MTHISDIKLIRTDTTLDLSQKAEKGMPRPCSDFPFYTSALFIPPLSYTMWDSAFENSKSGSTSIQCISLYALNLEGVLAYAIICRQGTIAFGDKIYFTSNVIQTTLQTLRDSR